MASLLRLVWRGLCWSALVLGVLVIGVAVVVPRLGGATPYTVLTGSMTPAYPPGTLVVTRPVEPDELTTGDVVTYQLRSGDPTVVTHRVVAVGRNTVSGEVVLTTQGDANTTPDAEPVRAVQVRGELWYAVPFLGRAGAVLTYDGRRLVVYGVAGALVLYAASMFGAALRDRRRGRGTDEAAAAGRHRAAEPSYETETRERVG